MSLTNFLEFKLTYLRSNEIQSSLTFPHQLRIRRHPIKQNQNAGDKQNYT